MTITLLLCKLKLNILIFSISLNRSLITFIYTVSQKNIPDIFDNLKTNYQLAIKWLKFGESCGHSYFTMRSVQWAFE